ncbi:MBL fold metallo-hydrolase [Ideonella livida]|uniref:MBL fold metallo-hydrolase n=1 Tax=Ideonella livida TaxID=2707176 RepID=A0A7C9PIH9_9BURK|nr:MBL fold metallo-hydrolase [Ideonella livida]NDY92668.1 MBL fold metallo-hydrolase [Ideonella livida]
MSASAVLADLGLQVLERDWLSANHIVAPACGPAPATVVDTGHVRHADMSLALIRHALGGGLPARLVNTHLHSDHCGGNAVLQQAAQAEGQPAPQTWVPAGHHAAATTWDEARLSYRATGQACARFTVQGALAAGDVLPLGTARWQVWAAPGHDPDALMLFEPQTRTLIAGDALWQDRLAIIFPELEDRPGFAATRATLDLIATLSPRLVIPGHGPVFEDAGAALAASRARLDAFSRDPARHTQHAARALAMYHLMEVRAEPRAELLAYLDRTPLFIAMAAQLGHAGSAARQAWARGLVQALGDQGLLRTDGGDWVRLPD